MKAEIQIIVNNIMPEPFGSEHGLSLYISYGRERILFDTGAGRVLTANLALAGIDPKDLTMVIFSHGHNDHTGGAAELLSLAPQADVYFAPGLTAGRFSRHQGKPVRELTMPAAARTALAEHPRTHEIAAFTEIAPGILLTGPIPRISGEDCGGPFFLDREGREKDMISDELALLLESGDLIQGCCHAGIINTVLHCKACAPGIKIRSITGGLHLLHASEERLEQTRNFLKELDPEELRPLHCTGDVELF